ncbi:O-antigen ligase family protein [Sphingomonas yabuuchiae]|uniref:O-antigen ligase family protein n=1 Tax=Sphingomonas yabuuchiae TaxID=172044 RepID=UPI003D9798FA
MVKARSTARSVLQPNLPFALAIAIGVILWVAGGASRGDVMGQVVTRAGAWIILIAAILAGPYPALKTVRLPLLIFIATVILPLIQLIPLPPSWWQDLPGREILLIPGEPIPWRPWTMSPSATRNALSSLIVPATILLLMAQMNDRGHHNMLTLLLAMVGTAVLLGLLQFSGAWFDNPLINETPGAVSGIFANRNHFGLFLGIGCLIAPVWAFMDREALYWRGPLAAGLLLLSILTTLATGSRAGALLAGLALVFTLFLVGKRVQRRLHGAPRWLLPALCIATIAVIGGFILLSFSADRADAINRMITLDAGDDLRAQARPTVLSMINLYMPFGSGFGGFDPVFRIHEPFDLLKLTYFNEAHNDFLGVALDGGIFGIAVLMSALIWWLIATLRVWRMKSDDDVLLGRLGSAMIFLILAASLTDYPARTPTIMAVLVIAAVWLSRARTVRSDAALPS